MVSGLEVEEQAQGPAICFGNPDSRAGNLIRVRIQRDFSVSGTYWPHDLGR